jgi:hypothetical protein
MHGKGINAYMILVGKPEGKTHPDEGKKKNIKIDLR